MIDENSRIEIQPGLADILRWDVDPGFELRPRRYQLAEAVARNIKGLVRIESTVTINYLCHVADEVGYLLQHRHSVDLQSTALKVARDVNQGDLIKMATIAEDCEWEDEHVSGRLRPALARLIEQKTSELVARILTGLIEERHLSEVGKPKGSHPRD